MRARGYTHPPWQPLTKEEYEAAISGLKPLKEVLSLETKGYEHVFCDGEACTLK
jgi:hypothetical protein